MLTDFNLLHFSLPPAWNQGSACSKLLSFLHLSITKVAWRGQEASKE